MLINQRGGEQPTRLAQRYQRGLLSRAFGWLLSGAVRRSALGERKRAAIGGADRR